MTELPGTPRFDVCGAVAGGRIYVLSGVHRGPSPKTGGYANVVDAWEYDLGRARWSRLPDLPHRSNQHGLAVAGRYVVMLGAYRYGITRGPDGRLEEVYTAEEKSRNWKTFFERTVMVFDTKTRRLQETDALLDTTSWPMAAVDGSIIFTLGGEGGRRLWHPATFQIGQVKLSRGDNHE